MFASIFKSNVFKICSRVFVEAVGCQYFRE